MLRRLLTVVLTAGVVLAVLSFWRPRVWPTVDVGSQAAQQTPETFLQATRRAIALGTDFIAVGTDLSILARGADALAAEYRG